MITNRLSGKRALVTAGAQGIGAAITRHLLAAGCDVFVHYRSSAQEAQTLAKEAAAAGRRCAGTAGDLTKVADCERVVAEAVKFLGGLDLLVNNAGSIVARKTLAEADEAYWAEVMGLNFDSLRRVTKAATPHLLASAKTFGGSSIINISSLAGRKGGHPGSLAYSSSKGAVLTFTRGLANELGPHGVRVNTVAPGFVQGTTFHQRHTTDESAKITVAGLPLGRAGRPDDIARGVVYLANEFDGFITGSTLDINGGQYYA
ncbi:MAG TPA: SDR family oxidoreductase [Opitutaceae bacterium]|nr:SDR family oxidoreductase [Opitutaceae bacterium]